jgi:hypothetical protein
MTYEQAWDAMNNLEMCISKVCSAREILDCAIEKLAEGDRTKTENLMYATDEFLQMFIKEFDDKFKIAWKEVVVKQKDDNENKTKTWVLPVEADPSGEYFLTFPDDLLEAAGLKEGDEIDWFDNGDGSYVFKKAATTETGTTTTPESPNTP